MPSASGSRRWRASARVPKRFVVGHDYRSYSGQVKQALISGLLAGGAEVHDIGLALSPMAYFRPVRVAGRGGGDGHGQPQRQRLDRHQDGVRTSAHLRSRGDDGAARTWCSQELARRRPAAAYVFVPDMAERYFKALTTRPKLKRKLKVVAACGNGTAGAWAPRVLEAIGCEVVPLDCDLDYTFPRYNPNPEDMKMLHAMSEAVIANKADAGFGFDGDGDRCGVVDNEGHEIFADKVGVMLARDLSARHANALFVADVKSTGLFMTDPVLTQNGAKTLYWKTGHSYMKRYTFEQKALVGFEKSGHFFFQPPLGKGYDDGFVSAIAVCDMLDRNPGKSLADLKNALPKTWGSPTMSPHCADEAKYGIVEKVTAQYQDAAAKGALVAGQKMRELVTVNGVRVVLDDGTWGLVRASSNKPELVIVVESPTAEANMRAIFADIDGRLAKFPEVGEYNQKI